MNFSFDERGIGGSNNFDTDTHRAEMRDELAKLQETLRDRMALVLELQRAKEKGGVDEKTELPTVNEAIANAQSEIQILQKEIDTLEAALG